MNDVAKMDEEVEESGEQKGRFDKSIDKMK